MNGMVAKVKGWFGFIGEARAELTKVTFPSRAEVIATTSVVLIASFIFATYLWVADIVIIRIYEWMLELLGVSS